MLNLKLHRIVLLPLVLAFLAANLAHAQTASVYFGMGTAMDSSNGQLIDTLGTGPLATPKMTGLFGTIGGEYMFLPHFGIGEETTFRFAQGGYAGLNYRPTLYDFNAIYMPTDKSKRIVPEFQAGLGGVKLSFYYNNGCNPVFCSTSSFLASSSHFQLHASGGVRFYVKGGMFLRPQVDLHWVNNFFQFGRNSVPEYSLAVGYTFGR